MASRDYKEGFADGWNAAYTAHAGGPTGIGFDLPMRAQDVARSDVYRQKKKRKQSGKAKLLTTMTAPVWKKYKRGNGKKTYVQIRAQVSRSQAYKKKAKRLS